MKVHNSMQPTDSMNTVENGACEFRYVQSEASFWEKLNINQKNWSRLSGLDNLVVVEKWNVLYIAHAKLYIACE